MPSGHVPSRTCVGCRIVCPAADLVRLVAAGDVVSVAPARAVGRGAWLHPSLACAQAALKGRAFARAFRRAVSTPPLEDLIAAVTSNRREKPRT